jgi:glycosyltransferase involved in cell wall biosynthesis
VPLLSVILPAHNQSKLVKQILEKINSLAIDKEIIVVDDGSTDDTGSILKNLNYNNLKVIHHTSRRGKGASLLTGLSHAAGEFTALQDIDLEYNPLDYFSLIEEVKKEKAGLILCARRLRNRLPAGLLNLFFNLKLSDYAAPCKLARKATFDELDLSANGAEIDIEIICNAVKKNIRILEVPLSYAPSRNEKNKTIRWAGGFRALFSIFKYRFRN